MKKRILSILVMLIFIVAMSANMAFAGTLKLEESYPKDGSKGMQLVNAGVKLYFSEDMASKEANKANKDCFKFTDSKGKEIPIKTFYSPKEKNVVLVLVDAPTLKSNAGYKLMVSKDVISAKGNTLSDKKDITIKIKTVNTKSAARANMVMMGVMMVAMIFMSRKAMQIQEEHEHEADILDEKVNPYKIAKETGKSVEEVIEDIEKKKAKAQKKLEKKREKMAMYQQDDYDFDDEEKSGNKRVSKPRSAAQASSKYVERLRAKKAKAVEHRKKGR